MTIDCVRSVLSDIGDLDIHIVVVDNASGDGSDKEIEDWIASQQHNIPVTLVRSTDNSGFSGGHNLGMSVFDADYFLILNSDALLRPGFFKAILPVVDESEKVGLFAPQIIDQEGTPETSCFRFASPQSEFIRSACTGFVTRVLKSHEVALGPYPDSREIEWASFACILLKAQMVEEIGFMDQGYFLYFEDSEYALRAQRNGWGIEQVVDAKAVHFRGGSGPVKSLAKAKKRLPPYYYASRTRFFYQRYGAFGLLLANLAYILGRFVAQFRRLVGKPVYKMAQSEIKDIWLNFFDPLGPHPRSWSK